MPITGTELAAYVGVVMSVLSLMGLTYVGAWRLAKIELKVDTMWDFLMRRAQSEAVQKGLATMNSPMMVKDDALSIMAPLAVRLRGFYESMLVKPDDTHLALLIEAEMGDDILRDICIPHGLLMGACLPLAVAVAKSSNQVIFH